MSHSMLLAFLIPISDIPCTIVIAITACFHDTRLDCERKHQQRKNDLSLRHYQFIIQPNLPSLDTTKCEMKNLNFHKAQNSNFVWLLSLIELCLVSDNFHFHKRLFNFSHNHELSHSKLRTRISSKSEQNTLGKERRKK